MDSYKSDIVNIQADAVAVFARLANPADLEPLIAKLPEEAKSKIENVAFTNDSIRVKANPVGEIVLQITECEEPSKIVYSAVTSPMPFSLVISIESVGEGLSKASASIDIQLNPFIKPMLNKPLNDAAKSSASY